MTQEYWIEKLSMEEHVEGGYVKAFYESPITVDINGKRPLATSIYFLITESSFSHFHSLKSDEIWYYHSGEALTITIITPEGTLEEKKLGLDIENGEFPKVLVPAGSIFSAHIPKETGYTLVSCMVSFGFVYEDFKLFKKEELLELYPQHKSVIDKFAS